jgi:hypothetical protein
MKVKTSIKHLQIDKDNNLMFIAVALAAVLVVFSLVSAKTLLGVSSYQHRVTLGGKTLNLSGQDGDNAKIVLDALPSSYDFPALISSVEKVANQDHIPLQGVGGTDQGSSPTAASAAPTTSASQYQNISFSVATQADYHTVQTLINDLERSIRPVDVTQFTITGSGNNLNVSVQANTYYQSPITLQIKNKEIH